MRSGFQNRKPLGVHKDVRRLFTVSASLLRELRSTRRAQTSAEDPLELTKVHDIRHPSAVKTLVIRRGTRRSVLKELRPADPPAPFSGCGPLDAKKRSK